MSHGATKWTISTVIQHVPPRLAQLNSIMFLTYPLSLDPPTRSKQINKALNKMVKIIVMKKDPIKVSHINVEYCEISFVAEKLP